MDFDQFDFALFIKDEMEPEDELHVRKVFYQGRNCKSTWNVDEKCDLYILMRRKNKTNTSTDWRLCVQTIHAMVFLV